jgi:outer membrane protein OmpA-like peptidoglycan-associated protein
VSGTKLNRAGFVLLASLMMTTALPAFAQTEVGNAPLPEVEVDGSVLQQLDPSAGTTQSLTPVQLIPPPSLSRQATSNSGPTLTDTVDLDPSGEKDVAIRHEVKTEAPSIVPPPEHVVAKAIVPQDAPPTAMEIRSIQPVSTQPIEETSPAQTIASQNIDEPVQAPVKDKADDEGHESFLHHYITSPAGYIAAPVKSLFGSKTSDPVLADVPTPPVPAEMFPVAAAPESDMTPAPASATKAGTVSPKPTNLADENRPAIIPQKKASKPVEVAAAKKPVPAKIDLSPVATLAPPVTKPAVTEIVMDVPGIPAPVTKAVSAPAKTVVAKVENIEDLTAPPKTMAEVEGIKAAVSRPVLFPISSKSKTRGDMNPEITRTSEAKTPIAPVIPQPDTKKALSNAMSDATVAKPQQVAVAVAAPQQAEPEIIYRNVPVPKPRPNVVVASKDFVEQARRTYEDTYKVVKRDGDQMPAVSTGQVSKETLSAPAAVRKDGPVRMSVADIASDPLASKLVAMTPDDIASALNSMKPAAGGRGTGTDEVVLSTNRVRIVRENGNWIPRKPSEATQIANADAGQNTNAVPPSDGRFNIAFQSNAIDLPVTSYGDVDSGVVNALRADSNARVQIVAYASAPDGKDTTAKRTSLARALSIRSYMISKGIDATRVDVRAMGLQQDSKALPDQVQMIVVPADAKKT